MVWLDCMERFLGAVEGLENQIQLKCNVLGSKLEDKKCSHRTNLWVLSQPSLLRGRLEIKKGANGLFFSISDISFAVADTNIVIMSPIVRS